MAVESANKPLVFGSADAVPFRQVRTIGQGGFASVDEVEGTRAPFQGKRYARKTIILRGKRESQQIQQDIQNEVDVLKSVQHSHVVRLITTYVHKEAYWSAYAMIIDPVADLDLQQYLDLANETDREHERKKLMNWFKCLINGLAYLHKNNIVHRDIKPHNILIKDDNILFTDFGISVLRDTDSTISTTITDSPRSRTPGYCAPEVDQGHSRGRSADVFSLGAVFLEILAVSTGPGRLEKLRESLVSYGRRSFAKNGEKALQSFSKTDETLYADPQRSTIFSLCVFMLNMNREKRPSADELASCWLYQPFLPMPPASRDCKSCSHFHSDSKDVNEAFLDAVKRLHTIPLLLLLDRGVDINMKGRNGYTPLHLAAENGDIEIMQLLLERGANPKPKGEDGNTPLMLAARGGHEDAVYMLVSKDEYRTPSRDLLRGDGYIDPFQAQALRMQVEELQLRLEFQRKEEQANLRIQKDELTSLFEEIRLEDEKAAAEALEAREKELLEKIEGLSRELEEEKEKAEKVIEHVRSMTSDLDVGKLKYKIYRKIA